MRVNKYSSLVFTLLFGLCLSLTNHSASAQYWAKGTVFLDRNSDASLDRFDFPQPAVRVNIYRDLDSDGVIDGVDTLVATGITNGDGNYEIRIPEGKLLNIRVSNNNDDAEEEIDDGSMDRNSTDLELTEDGGDNQLVGIRFRNVPLVNSETINQAYITFTVDETNSGATNITFEGQDTDNSNAFNNSANDISSRTRTTADVDWSNIPAWTASRQKQVSPDLTSIVDEVITRGGWTSGNALTFIISGSGERTAESHDGSNANGGLWFIYHKFYCAGKYG